MPHSTPADSLVMSIILQAEEDMAYVVCSVQCYVRLRSIAPSLKNDRLGP